VTILKFYGGIGEVGGNKILLKDQDTEILLDFGKNFERERQYYDAPYLEPREERHLLALGILPPIEGLYKKGEGLRDTAGILLSHPHIDHMDYIRYIKDEIPIYCGETTKTIIVTREFTGRTSSSDYYIANLTAQRGEKIFKDFRTFRTGDVVKIGSIEIEPIHVDHSVPGAYGFIIRTSGGTIVYTGDFRLHGTEADMSFQFIEKAKASKPDALIIEGTNVGEGKVSSEQEVRDKTMEIIVQTKALVIASFSPVDIDRLRTFYEVAKANRRKLALSTKQAYLIEALEEDKGLSIFNLSDPNILIFARQKRKPQTWEKRLLESYPNVVESAALSQAQDEIILSATFYDMNEMCDIRPEAGTVFILSQSEPFNEEMEIDFKKLLNWMEYYGIPLYNIHASGHAAPLELKETISQIAPKKVYLIHTERPKLYQQFIRDLNIKTLCPEPAQEYQI